MTLIIRELNVEECRNKGEGKPHREFSRPKPKSCETGDGR